MLSRSRPTTPSLETGARGAGISEERVGGGKRERRGKRWLHSIPQLEEIAAREDPPAILEEFRALRPPVLLLPGGLFPLKPRGAACLQPGSADGG